MFTDFATFIGWQILLVWGTVEWGTFQLVTSYFLEVKIKMSIN